MLSEPERRELQNIELALCREDPALARTLARGPQRSAGRMWVRLAVAVGPVIVAGFVHPAAAILIGLLIGAAVAVVAMFRG